MIRNYHPLVTAALIGVMATNSLGAGEIFRDDFSAPSLQPGWTIVRPDPSTYSLTAAPGFFRVLTARGLLGEEGTAKNLLVRPASGNFILDTRLEFDPRDGQPFAGLLIYQDDAHAVSIGLVFASGQRGAFRGVVMLNVGDNVDGTNLPATKYDETNAAQPSVIYLRLLRQGNQFIGAFSDDGVSYRELGTVTNELSTELSVGVGAANGDSESCGPACDVPIPALFDYFAISDLSGGPSGQRILESLDMEGPTEVASGGSGTFQAIAHFNDGASTDVSDVAEWIVAPPDGGTIEQGVLHTAEAQQERYVTVVATYTQTSEIGPITRTNAVLVRVIPNSQAGSNRLCGTGVVGVLLPLFLVPLAWRECRRRSFVDTYYEKA